MTIIIIIIIIITIRTVFCDAIARDASGYTGWAKNNGGTLFYGL